MDTLRSDYESPKGITFKTGSLITLPISELMDNDWKNAFSLFTPTPTKSLSDTTDYMIIKVMEDVSVSSPSCDSSADNTFWLWRDGYLVPNTLEIASAEECCAVTEPLKAKPVMSNADGLTVEQHFATSKDGTRIPYFVMRHKDLVIDGSNPVLLDSFGGGL